MEATTVKREKVQNFCRFCLKSTNWECYVKIDDVENIIQKCGLEIDFQIIEAAAICQSCLRCLEDYFHFIVQCLESEQKTVDCFETTENGDVLECICKVETNEGCPEKETKHKINDLKMILGVKYVQNYHVSEGEQRDLVMQRFPEYTTILGHKNSHQTAESTLVPEIDEQFSLDEIQVFECQQYNFRSKRNTDIAAHLLTHKKSVEIKTFECERCNFKFKRRYDLRRHMITHQNPGELLTYRCTLCSYTANQQSYLNKHMQTHRNPDEITSVPCALCTYKAKNKNRLKKHLITYHKLEKTTVFQCKVCSYRTKRKSNYKQHVLTHKNEEEVTMFHCQFCSYRGKNKGYLKKHMVLHLNPETTTMFQCSKCHFMTKRISSLNSHSKMAHERDKRTPLFNSELCDFRSTEKANFKMHNLIHKSPGKEEKLSKFACINL